MAAGGHLGMMALSRVTFAAAGLCFCIWAIVMEEDFVCLGDR